jgi:hypothetical protein
MVRKAGIRELLSRLAATVQNRKPIPVEISRDSGEASLPLPESGQNNVSMDEIYRRCYNNDFGVGLPPASGRSNDLS